MPLYQVFTNQVTYTLSQMIVYILCSVEPVPASIDTWSRGIVPLSNDDLLIDQNPFDRLLCKSISDLHPPADDKLVASVLFETCTVFYWLIAAATITFSK